MPNHKKSDVGQRTQEQRRAETRGKLLDCARKLFIEHGYAQTGTPQIVKAAGVTRGALYHHFADKKELFHELAKRESMTIATAIRDATVGLTQPNEAMRIGTEAYFDAMAVSGRARLLLAEAPAVLGHGIAMELTREQGSRQLKAGLEQSLPTLDPDELDALSDVLSAAFDRAALAIAEGAGRFSYINALMKLIPQMNSR